MAREEAANILSNDIIDGHVEGNARFMDAFWFAVDNLKAEPCEDAVSRADTLQSFESYCENNCQYSKKQRDVMCGACMMGDAIEIVENLPPVTPKPTECEDVVSREHLLSEIDKLMQSPWFNSGKDSVNLLHYGYIERKEAVEVVRDLCVKTEPPVTPEQNDSINAVLDEIKREFKIKADGDDWYHTTDGLVWEEAIEIIDKHRKGESE